MIIEVKGRLRAQDRIKVGGTRSILHNPYCFFVSEKMSDKAQAAFEYFMEVLDEEGIIPRVEKIPDAHYLVCPVVSDSQLRERAWLRGNHQIGGSEISGLALANWLRMNNYPYAPVSTKHLEVLENYLDKSGVDK